MFFLLFEMLLGFNSTHIRYLKEYSKIFKTFKMLWKKFSFTFSYLETVHKIFLLESEWKFYKEK